MQLEAKVDIAITRPPDEVFEAIVDPTKMSHYFISSGSGRMETGKRVEWRWDDVAALLSVDVREVVAPSRVSFTWAASGVTTQADLSIEGAGETTRIRVVERGWPKDDEGIARYGLRR